MVLDEMVYGRQVCVDGRGTELGFHFQMALIRFQDMLELAVGDEKNGQVLAGVGQVFEKPADPRAIGAPGRVRKRLALEPGHVFSEMLDGSFQRGGFQVLVVLP